MAWAQPWLFPVDMNKSSYAELLHVPGIGPTSAQKILDHKLNLFLRPRDFDYWLMDAIDLAKDLPYNAGIIMREIRKGRIKIEFEHIGLEPIRRTMERMSNRDSLTNIIVALLISSSLVVLAKVPPFV
jgi:hypothetical protein